MIPAPPAMLSGETATDAADRLERAARNLSWFAEEHAARAQAYAASAEEAKAHAEALRAGAR